MLVLKDHVDGGPNAPPLSAGIKRMFMAGFFLALPSTVDATVRALVGGGFGGMSFTGGPLLPVAGPATLDTMAVNFIADISGPISTLLSVFVYLSGLIIIMIAISRLARSHQEGWRGPAGLGTIVTLLAGGALLASADMMHAFSTSIFGDATSFGNPIFSGAIAASMTAPELARLSSVIRALLNFVVIVGWIAFIRGWFVLKAVADGNSQVSIAQALTFLFGGALAVNIGEVVNMIQSSVGGPVLGISFG